MHCCTRALEHPQRERPNGARLLGHRDEPIGKNEPELRMLPAHQRLDAENLARLQIDFRLVDDAQLVARDGVPEIPHQRETLGAVAIELGRIDDAAGAIFLGDVHRDVGALHEHFGLGAMLGRNRDADAAVHVEVQPFDA